MCPAYCGRHHFGMHQAACTQATVARNNCRHRAAYTQPTMADSTCLGRTTCTDSTRVHRAAAPNIQWQTVLACTELHVQTAHACTELHVQKVQCSRFDPLQGLFPGPVLVNSNFFTCLSTRKIPPHRSRMRSAIGPWPQYSVNPPNRGGLKFHCTRLHS